MKEEAGHKKEFSVTEGNKSWKKETYLKGNKRITGVIFFSQEKKYCDNNHIMLTGTNLLGK